MSEIFIFLGGGRGERSISERLLEYSIVFVTGEQHEWRILYWLSHCGIGWRTLCMEILAPTGEENKVSDC